MGYGGYNPAVANYPWEIQGKAQQARGWGIAGMVIAPFSVLLSVIGIGGAIACNVVAIVMGNNAKRALAPYGPNAPGLRQAEQAVRFGIIGLCLIPVGLLVMAAIVFVLVTKLNGVR